MSHAFDDSHVNLLARCPSCQARFASSGTRVVAREGSQTIMHLQCEVCRQAMLLSVKERPRGISCTGTITDLSFQDALAFWNGEKVTADDVIQAHTALQLDKFLKKS